MESAKNAADRDAVIARLAADFDGKEIVLLGFIVGKTGDSSAKIMIGKYAWDGKANGTPPGLYNTVLVNPRTASDMPPVWWQEAVYKGTIRVMKEPSERAKNGIVSLHGAILAVPPSQAGELVDTGPLLPLAYEILILMVCGGGGGFLLKLFSKSTGRQRMSFIKKIVLVLGLMVLTGMIRLNLNSKTETSAETVAKPAAVGPAPCDCPFCNQRF